MSSSNSSSSGTGAKSLSRLRRRSSLRRAAAALAAAAAVWTPIATAIYGKGPAIWSAVLVAIVAVGVFLGRERLAAYTAAVALSAVAFVAASMTFLVTGCIGSNGHIDRWMWATGAAVVAVGCAWGVLDRRRLLWALPAATYIGLVVADVLALVINGSTGWCPD